MEKAFQMIFCPEGSKISFVSCQLEDRAKDSWEEVSHALEEEVVEAMTWDELFTRFKAEFMPFIEVQQLAREL